MTSPESAFIYLSLGSNIKPEQNLYAAVKLLGEACTVLAISPVYRSAPQGFADQPDFLNMAVLVQLPKSMNPFAFKQQIIGDIETALGRVRDPNNKNAPRTIDLDIALWNNDAFDYGHKSWHIPDPDILRFAHVAVPLADIAPDYLHPETGQTLAEIAAALDSSTMQPSFVAFDKRFVVNIEGAIYQAGRYLMVIRGEAEDHAAGALAFVGGTIEGGPADDVIEATLRREIREEVGLEVAELQYVCSKLFGSLDEPVVNLVFLCRYTQGEVVIGDPGEVASVTWLSASEIRQHPACPPWLPDYLQAVESKRAALGW
jgi:2-amino-4-hydroxy-6-hydroxymethyldihydropteridine diphosphokinase